jgi:hypothetical protein
MIDSRASNTPIQGAYHRNDLCHRMIFMSAHTLSQIIVHCHAKRGGWSMLAAINVTYDL